MKLDKNTTHQWDVFIIKRLWFDDKNCVILYLLSRTIFLEITGGYKLDTTHFKYHIG